MRPKVSGHIGPGVLEPVSALPQGDLPLTLKLKVEGIAYGAKGIARHEGKVYFIPDAVIGDEIEAAIVQDNDRYADAEIINFIKPSSLRGPAACEYATSCGGCQWMGIDYLQQLEWKRSFVTSALTRIGKLGSTIDVPIIAAPAVTGYRNRILLRLHLHPDGTMHLGYFRRQSRDLVPIKQCTIAAPAINDLITAIHAMPLQDYKPFTVRLEVQEIPQSETGHLLVTVYPGEGHRESMNAFTNDLKTLSGVHWVGTVFDLKNAPTVLFESDLDRKFFTKAAQFHQVNLELNRTLRRMIFEHVEAAKPQRILDVFCGSGNLSLPLANGARYIEGIEANKDAIKVARQNADLNKISNATYLAGDAEKHLWKVSRDGESFDMVLLDPPRQGFHKGMVPLKNLAPRTIVYVSCDPTTLARDLAYLCRADEYRLTKVVALDFFPNTYHVETVAFLERTNGQ